MIMERLVIFIFISIVTLLVGRTTSEPVLAVGYPYVAKIYFVPLAPGQQAVKCTGAVYNENYLVTSTRCALPEINRKCGNRTHDYGDVILGTEQINKICHPGELVYIRYIVDVIVPGDDICRTDTILQRDNIALLKTNKPIIFSKTVRAIKIPYDASECDLESSTTYAGYGAWEASKNNRVFLHKMIIREEPHTRCIEHTQGFRSYDMICVRVRERSDESCVADTGSPLVNFATFGLHQAPVPLTYPVHCGTLPTSSCDRYDQARGLDNYIEILKWTDWLEDNAGRQNPKHFVDIQ